MLIDANVFKGYFQFVLGKAHDLCGCPSTLIQNASLNSPIYHDSAGIIEHEWRNLVDREWFDGWLASNLASGTIQYTDSQKNQQIEKQISNVGFPVGRDVVYIRTALSIATANGNCDFYTEDLDFYDPPKKRCSASTRTKILRNSTGAVAKILRRNDVYVRCVP